MGQSGNQTGQGSWADEDAGASRESVEGETWRGEYPDTQDQRRQRAGYWGEPTVWYDRARGWGYRGGWVARFYPPGTYGQPDDSTGFDQEVERGVAEYGPYHGRGPRGYQRDDNRIMEDVCEALTHHGHIDASDVEVEVKGGEVWLRGMVETRVQKRAAEDVAMDVSGVLDVHNELKTQTMQGIRGNETVIAEPEPFLGRGRARRSLQ